MRENIHISILVETQCISCVDNLQADLFIASQFVFIKFIEGLEFGNKFLMPKADVKMTRDKIITVYHQMSYGTQHEQEAETLKKIVQLGFEVLEPFERLFLRIYCRPRTTSSLVMRNNTTQARSLEETTNVVYLFKCPVGACERRTITYIGLTSTTLRRRMLAHRNNGAINKHYTKEHDRKPLLTELLQNTTVIHRENVPMRLNISEAVSIAVRHPVLNIQTESDYILPSVRRKVNTTRSKKPAIEDEPADAPTTNVNTSRAPDTPPNDEAAPTAEAPPTDEAAPTAEAPPTDEGAPTTEAPPTDDALGPPRLGPAAEPPPAHDADAGHGRRLRSRRSRPAYTE